MVERLKDRGIIFIICVISSLILNASRDVLVAGLVSIILVCMLEYFDKVLVNRIVLYLIVLLAIFFSPFLMFIPLFVYGFRKKELFNLLVLVLPFLLMDYEITLISILLYIFLIGLSLILCQKTDSHAILHEKYIKTRDELIETTTLLNERLESTISEQDAQIKLATVNERNRIAREIHDNVGHLLSSSILQLGAVMILEKDEATLELLENLKKTLDESMNSIRSSVHDIRDENVDLQKAIKDLVVNFNLNKKSKAILEYDFSTVPTIKEKYATIAIVKEALSNIIKHSDATRVTIRLNEHPKLRQIIISDNGTTANKLNLSHSTGMGMENIKQRTDALGGILNISNENGFKIFISYPKE